MMHFLQLLTAATLTATAVNGMQYANPFVKHAARALVVDRQFGSMLKRQTSCPEGQTVCGSGCSEGPCCDNSQGLACRANEVCTTVDNQTACCAEGYVCGAVRDCESAYGTGCTPGSVNNGHLCCDAAAPMCNTMSGTPYCSGIAVSTTYVAQPVADQTLTSSVTATSTALVVISAPTQSTMTMEMTSTSTSTLILPAQTQESETSTMSMTSTATQTVVLLPTLGSDEEDSTTIPSYGSATGTMTMSVISGSTTLVMATTMYDTSVIVVPLPTETSDLYTIQTINPTSNSFLNGTTTQMSIESTSTSTAFLTVYPVPTMNGTMPGMNATMTGLPAPTEAVSAAGRLGVNVGCALVGVLGLVVLLL